MTESLFKINVWLITSSKMMLKHEKYLCSKTMEVLKIDKDGTHCKCFLPVVITATDNHLHIAHRLNQL